MLCAYKVFFALVYPQRELAETMKNLLACLALLAAFSTTAQNNGFQFPYNPDAEPDGYIGVHDILEVLAWFGAEWEVATLDADSTSAIVLVNNQTSWMQCKQQCKTLGKEWDIISVDGSAVHLDTLTSSMVLLNWGDPDEPLAQWFVNDYDKQDGPLSIGGFGPYMYQLGRADGQDLTCWCEAKVRPEIEYSVCPGPEVGLDSDGVWPHFQSCVDLKLSDGWLPLGGLTIEDQIPRQAFWRYAE